ncbi:hypothetical protein C8F04DRAFT_1257959 [Mycena alexandri]|uniref:Uncharacterized protein n=1 Tax=Mycena alexandri TaxID=1745969 RepID=A0AAD6X5M0_9AGAR|nr:hypothetical protein C8F04DRAFT_1257959 [Mycena alexandri]
MTTKQSPIAKLKKPKRKVARDSPFRPGLTEEEREGKAARHRKAQREYQARSMDICEKQRIYAAEKRAAVKARRRCRDPPKPPKKVVAAEEHAQAENDSLPPSDITFNDFRAASYLSFPDLARDASEEPIIGTAGSPSPDERIACDALAALAQGGPYVDKAHETASSDSARSTTFTDSKVSAARLPSGVAPLTRTQVISVQSTGAVGRLTHVQSAQMRVALMNRTPPLPATPELRSRWAEPPLAGFDRLEAMDEGRFSALNHWRHGVAKHFCEEYEFEREEEFELPGSSPSPED